MAKRQFPMLTITVFQIDVFNNVSNENRLKRQLNSRAHPSVKIRPTTCRKTFVCSRESDCRICKLVTVNCASFDTFFKEKKQKHIEFFTRKNCSTNLLKEYLQRFFRDGLNILVFE